MKLMVLGGAGMLGQALSAEAEQRGWECTCHSRRNGLDVSDDKALERVVTEERPEVVINAAAEVSLSRCEEDAGLAYQVNGRPSAVLAGLSAEQGFRYVYISTDHYFAGDGDRTHDESAPVQLLNEYARTKYIGETFTLAVPSTLVVRTNIVGFRGDPDRPTFVEWVLDNLEQGASMALCEDYYTSSIDVGAFASALFDLMPYRLSGVLNLAGSQVASKKEFILSLGRSVGLTAPYSTTRLRDLAGPRRADSLGLDVNRAQELLGGRLPGLDAVTQNLARIYRTRRSNAVSP